MARSVSISPHRESIRSPLLWILLAAVAALFFATVWIADPDSPDSDVLLILPERKAGETVREQALKTALRSNPLDSVSASALAKIYIQRARNESDPRQLGYAQHALSHWRDIDTPPPDIQRVRAILHQSQHSFDASLNDLNSLLKNNPQDTQSLLTRATVYLVTGNYRLAKNDCIRLIVQSPVLGAGCSAAVFSITGKIPSALLMVKQIETQLGKQDPETRQWLLTIMAEASDRAGQAQKARKYYESALAEPRNNDYLLRSYSTFLLRIGNPHSVLDILRDKTRDDSLLLLAITAAKRIGDQSLSEQLLQQLTIRLRNADLRRSTDHYYPAAYVALEFENNLARALALAKKNWAQSKEIRDAELLAKAAVAQNDQSTIEELRRWMTREHAILPRVTSLLKSKGDFQDE